MDVKEEIIKAANSIRKKYKLLKKDWIVKENESKKYFEPLVKPLQTLVDLTKTSDHNSEKPIISKQVNKKEEVKLLENFGLNKYQERESHNKKLSTPMDSVKKNLIWSHNGEDNLENILSQNWRKYSEHIGPVSNEYLTNLWRDKDGKFDTKFGVRVDANENTWRIGNIEIDFDINDDIHIKDRIFKGTPGLFELLFKKLPNPDIYTKEDLNAYKEILLASNAHLQKYDKDKPIASSSGLKYRSIIQKIFSATGSGFLPVTNKKVDYIRWNDINELVERLFLLRTAQKAGHSGVEIEINSIEQELKEEGVIE